MKGQLFVGELTILLQDGAAQHLLGGHPFPAGGGASRAHQILIGQFHHLGSGIQHQGDLLQLLCDLVSGDGREQVQLGIEFSAHAGSLPIK